MATPKAAGGGKLRGVEAGRGIAAVLVVLVHATDMLKGPTLLGGLPLDGLFKFGRAGVDFFFVLSGFIIYYVHRGDLGRPGQLGSYAWKRFARIFPTYWVVLAGLGVIILFYPERDPATTSWGNIWASILLLPRLQDPILGVAWTLRHELLFYLLFAGLILNRTLGRVVLGIWAALLAWQIGVFTFTLHPWFTGMAGYLPFRVFNFEFFFGMGVAVLLARGPARAPGWFLILGTALFFGNGLMESFGSVGPVEWPPHQLLYGVASAMALYGAVGLERAGRLSVPNWLFAIGSASYSIYLTHLIPLMTIQHFLPRLRGLVPLPRDPVFLLAVAACVIAGVVFSRLVEQPLLRALRDPLRSRRPARAAAP
ncbi:MAG: acyltransferase family protein [Acetobacteraceae bacterium]